MKMVNWARLAATACLTIAATMPVSALTLPFGLGAGGDRATEREPRQPVEPTVRYAQAGDPLQRINQLEEDNRRLNGRVEELSFQLLQMQEQLRKMQEDNEFRFQELEGGRASGAAANGQRTEAAPPRTSPSTSTGTAGVATGLPPASAEEDEIGSLLGDGLDTSGLGTPGATAPAAGSGGLSGSGTVAAVTPSGPGELYDLAYNYILAGDYELAENSFRQYAQTYPDAADVPDAEYWLGESLYQQAKYTDAAETFLNAQKQHPQSPKAAEMMLKLGMSLAKLDNRETACVTFREVGKRYPQMSANVKKKLQSETAATNC
ncbi:MAG: tol-pal system protein YbgF [Rhizobiaceae bacterium]|nr:tol-pal system protein YbgF [Rhizobiaceae bacterium]